MMTKYHRAIAALGSSLLLSCNQQTIVQSNDSESLPPTWEELVTNIGPSTYSIGLLASGKLIGVGSGFAINDSTIATNAHVVKGIEEYLIDYGDELTAVAVRNGGSVYGTGFHYLNSFAIHPNYSSTTTETFDFGIVTTTTKLSTWAQLASTAEIQALKAGTEVGTIGFPGELNPINTVNATATFKNGTISALRAFNGAATTPANAFFIQHNLNLSGGTSGSPIFNRQGKVVAVNNAGIETLVNSDGNWTRIPIASLGFGIRVDQFSPTLTATKTLFSSLRFDRVTYTFINDSWSDAEIWFPLAGIRDTIGWKDTLSLWDRATNTGTQPFQLKTIVATKNSLVWTDTLVLGKNFERSYYVPSQWFLLGITNNTNRSLRSVVVSNSLAYDSTALSMSVGTYRDVGYYYASTSTNFRLYFNNTTTYLSQNNANTLSSNTSAYYYTLSPSNILSKPNIEQVPKIAKKHIHKKLRMPRKTN